ncbi:MAG: hypothetical protein LBS18_08320 [Clostridiales bacterium]|jgi:cytochrome bd-type quinol oxidase subunit 2|nr:hypothetical protein [Clostridiales bacterium]
MGDMFGMFDLFELIIGAYLLYGAVTGKGKIFQNENVKKGMEAQYKKRMRLFCWILGPLMVGCGLLSRLNPGAQNAAMLSASRILWGLSCVLIIILFVISISMTDRAKAKARAAGKSTTPSSRAAFEFDNDEAAKKGK